jgi:hypothetical protein
MSTETEKLDIAIEYLDTASTLWIHEISYFSAMHLAAAAEEIAGKACRIAGISAYFDDVSLEASQMLLAAGIEHTGRQLKDAAYGAKNAIKHMDNRTDTVVNLDARKKSADYIWAAYRNFEKLGVHERLSETVRRVVDANPLRIYVDE